MDTNDLVAREVIVNVSMLIDFFIRNHSDEFDIPWAVEPTLQDVIYEIHPCESNLHVWEEAGLTLLNEYFPGLAERLIGTDIDLNTARKIWEALKANPNMLDEQKQRDLIEQFLDIKDYSREISEYWLVSDWLGEKLKEQGECVFNFELLPFVVWGRTCTGQSIYLDKCVNHIAGV